MWLVIAATAIFILALLSLLFAAAALTRARAARGTGDRGLLEIATEAGSLPVAGSVWEGEPSPARIADPRTPECLRVLDERYARGEIGRLEYMQRRKDIESRIR